MAFFCLLRNIMENVETVEVSLNDTTDVKEKKQPLNKCEAELANNRRWKRRACVNGIH